MMVTLEEAQTKLAELIAQLHPGEELLITRDSQPIARLIGVADQQRRPVAGRGRGKLIILSEDDDHLKDFEDYM